MITERRSLGDFGEQAVVRYLQDKDFTILATNYVTRLGEVDIIAELDDLIVFVEVKTRKHEYFETASVITLPKQRRIIAATKGFILEHKVQDRVCRFDVATVVVSNHQKPKIEYIESAFYGE